MKSKALLIAAAALAAGVMSSQAQSSVYSQNIVGYVNVPETAGGFSLEAAPLDLDGTGTNNTFATVFSNPSINDNVYLFSGGQYQLYTYEFKAAHGANPASTNWISPSGSIANSFSINPGQSYFYNAASNETNTYVGNVLTGVWTNSDVPAANGFALVSSQVPIAGGLTSVLGYQPNINDNVYLYSGGQYQLYTYEFKAAHGANPASTNWINPSGAVAEPQIQVGQGFWLNPAATPTWVETFTNL